MPFRNVVPLNLWMPMTQIGGIQQSAAATMARMPHRAVADYEDILARPEALPKRALQNIALLQERMKRGYTPPNLTPRQHPNHTPHPLPPPPIATPPLHP